MATARDIITSALRKIHVLGIGAALDSTEADQALQTLNDLLSTITVEGCTIYESTKESFSLTGAESYTIGSGLDFSTTAPIDIISAYVTIGGVDYPLEKMGEKEYFAIYDKDLPTTYPCAYYYDGNHTTPRIYVYPVSSGTITLVTRKPLPTFSTLTTTFDMPAHYKPMLIHNLAVWVAPEYEREASFTVQSIAERTYQAIKTQNNRNNPRKVISMFPADSIGYYDIDSGEIQ